MSRSFHGGNKAERLARKRTQLAENRARRQATRPVSTRAADGQARMTAHNAIQEERSRALREHALSVVSANITQIAPRINRGDEWSDIAADLDLSITAARRAWVALHQRGA